jgi:nicotinamide phosphoribosyltransferase
MFKIFAPHAADFYKTGHPFMFPEQLEELYGNFTPRGDKLAKVLPDFDHKITWVGFQPVLQYLLIDLWNDTFFNVPKEKAIAKYKRRMDLALGEGEIPTWKLADLHDLGYLPLTIKALPEGVRVDIRVPPYTVKSNQPKHAWIEQYIETQMSAEVWKPLTTATSAFEFRRLFTRYAIETGIDLGFVDWQGHDFSMRGMSGLIDATTSGAAHLMLFNGSDTISAIDFLEDYYPDTQPIIAGSVPATEHAVSSSNIIMIAASLEKYGQWNGWTTESLNPRLSDPYLYQIAPENRQAYFDACPIIEMAEVAFLKHMLVNVKPKGIFSYVADTYDFWAVVTRIANHLKKEIMAREGKVVFRPDSGDPVKILVGDVESRLIASPEYEGAVQVLWSIFGGKVNSADYAELDSHVGLIYGDSISLERAGSILEGLKLKGFASSNAVFGIGSFTYQFVTRDTFGTAIKATHAVIAGQEHDLFKDPKTDNGMKKSARGFIRIENEDGHYVMYDRQTREQEAQGELKVVFENSKMVKMHTANEVRARIRNAVLDICEIDKAPIWQRVSARVAAAK